MTADRTRSAGGPVETEVLVWTIPEVARLLGISERTAYAFARQGVIPNLKVGRRIVVPKRALTAYLDSVRSTAELLGQPQTATPRRRGDDVA